MHMVVAGRAGLEPAIVPVGLSVLGDKMLHRSHG